VLYNGSIVIRKGDVKSLEKESMRYYDQKTGLWYIIHWDNTLKCYVSQLISGQQSVVAAAE